MLAKESIVKSGILGFCFLYVVYNLSNNFQIPAKKMELDKHVKIEKSGSLISRVIITEEGKKAVSFYDSKENLVCLIDNNNDGLVDRIKYCSKNPLDESLPKLISEHQRKGKYNKLEFNKADSVYKENIKN